MKSLNEYLVKEAFITKSNIGNIAKNRTAKYKELEKKWNADSISQLKFAQKVGELFDIDEDDIEITYEGTTLGYTDIDEYWWDCPMINLKFGTTKNTKCKKHLVDSNSSEFPMATVITDTQKDSKSYGTEYIAIGVGELVLRIDYDNKKPAILRYGPGVDEESDEEPPFYSYDDWKFVASKVNLGDILINHYGEDWKL